MLNGQALSSSADDAQELELTVVANGDEDDDMDAHRAPPGMVADARDEGAVPGAHGQIAAGPPQAHCLWEGRQPPLAACMQEQKRPNQADSCRSL